MMRLGVCVHGAGWVAGEHVRAYLRNPDTDLVAISSRKEESARDLADRFGVQPDIYTRYEQVLEDDRVDIVSLCTPHHLHAAETIAAAKAGKHILIEKPVALNLHDLKAMRNAVREAKVKTVVSFVLRWNPLFDCIKALLAEGAIGNVFYAEVDYWHGIGPWYRQYEWSRKKEYGVSSFLNAGCHAIDALRYFVGAEVTEVSAYTSEIMADPNYEYPPTIVAIMKFETGAIGKSCSSVDCKMPYRFNIDLLGTEGTIRENKLWSKKLLPGQTFFAEVPTILPDSGDVTHHPFNGEIDHLVDCILKDEESHVNLEDAVKTHEICIAADLSAVEGHPVTLPLIRD